MESACTYLLTLLPSKSTPHAEASDRRELDSHACLSAARDARRVSSGFYLVEAGFIIREILQYRRADQKTFGSYKHDKQPL